jgi:hypothetical protein
MSRIITTRTSLQCRSHHQKIIRKRKSVEGILAGFKLKLTFRQKMEASHAYNCL